MSHEDVTNSDRATWAHAALCAFAEQTGQRNDLLHDPVSVLADLLCDLRHWADVDALDWTTAGARAEMHYTAEAEDYPHCDNADCGNVLDFDSIQAGDGLCRYCHERADVEMGTCPRCGDNLTDNGGAWDGTCEACSWPEAEIDDAAEVIRHRDPETNDTWTEPIR